MKVTSKAFDYLAKFVLVVGVITTAFMMLITVADVLLRYSLNKPFFGTTEITQYSLIVIVFTGLALVTRSKSHIVVTVFEQFLMARIPKFYRFLSSFFNFAGAAVISFLLFEASVRLIQLNQTSLVLGLVEGWIILVPAFFALIAAIFGFEVFFTNPISDTDDTSGDQPDSF